MSQHESTGPVSSHAPFQARIASVALITTVAVLLAACATFMIQQWAVSRQEARATTEALNTVVAEMAAPALAAGDTDAARRAVAAVVKAPGVRSARLIDARGRVVAQDDALPSEASAHTVRTPVTLNGREIGALVSSVESPTLAALAVGGAMAAGGVMWANRRRRPA